MIEIKDLRKTYEKRTVLAINELNINAGELIGLIGNNGAGKTTLLSLILDLIESTQGVVKSKSVKVSETDDWKNYTGSFLNEGFLIPFLTPMEFLEFIGKLHNKNEADVNLFLEANIGFYSDDIKQKKYIKDLSAGNKSKVGILASFLFQPEILILDEPFANLDPTSQSWLKVKLEQLNKQGTTILISSHDLNHVTDICKRIVLLDNGNIIKDSDTNAETLSELENYFNVLKY